MYQEQEYVKELASKVNDLFTHQGNEHPTALEIAEANFPDKMLGKEIVGGIRKRLPKIRKELEEKYGLPVCLVSKTFYDYFKCGSIQTMDDARRCLPLGNGRKAEGLYLPSDVDDLIRQATNELNLNAGAGKVKKSKERVAGDLEEGRSTPSKAGEIFAGARDRMILDRPELETNAIKALEQGDQEQDNSAAEKEK